MFTVSLFAHGKEQVCFIEGKQKALDYARRFWHLSPIIRTWENKLVLADDGYCAFDSEL